MFIDNLQIALFSKCVQDYPLEKLAEKLQPMGIKFIDLTVRPGGHVEPEKVEEQLPAIHEKLAKAGISISMITTNIIDAGENSTGRILKTAAGLGIKYYKLGYFAYKGFGTLRKQREEVADSDESGQRFLKHLDSFPERSDAPLQGLTRCPN